MALALNGITIESRNTDNFINATQLCKAGGKKFNDWYRLDSTKELIKELENSLKSDAHYSASPKNIYAVDIKKGNSKKYTQGTWIHPDLAVQLAQWISPSFAIQVSRWIRELLITGKVEINTNKTDEELLELQKKLYKLELENKENILRLHEKENALVEKNNQLNRLHNIQKELLSYKKRVLKEEIVYIVSTENYARQGIFKVGRTKKAMKFRSSSHNTTHIPGDKVKVIREFKVNDSVLVERNIHTKCKGLALDGEQEFFMCPYNLLENIIDLIVNNDDEENQIVNHIIDTVYKLKQLSFNTIQWTDGIPRDLFNETMTIADGESNLAVLNITEWTDLDKKKFIEKCVAEYKATDQIIKWKTFQSFLINKLDIPRSKFKSLDWRPIAEQVAKDKKYIIKLRDI